MLLPFFRDYLISSFPCMNTVKLHASHYNVAARIYTNKQGKGDFGLTESLYHISMETGKLLKRFNICGNTCLRFLFGQNLFLFHWHPCHLFLSLELIHKTKTFFLFLYFNRSRTFTSSIELRRRILTGQFYS